MHIIDCRAAWLLVHADMDKISPHTHTLQETHFYPSLLLWKFMEIQVGSESTVHTPVHTLPILQKQQGFSCPPSPRRCRTMACREKRRQPHGEAFASHGTASTHPDTPGPCSCRTVDGMVHVPMESVVSSGRLGWRLHATWRPERGFTSLKSMRKLRKRRLGSL